ncbi:MAG TPA: sensor histidine kinase, partial [Rhodobacteraceae bacterium]|nr:sensor histidine kinase [Paracoccaceae bacterium]
GENPADAADAHVHVQRAREKLAARAGGPVSYTYELLQLYVRNQLSMSLGIPLLAVILATASTIWMPWNHTMFWLAGVFCAQGILLVNCEQFNSTHRQMINTVRWGWRLTAVEFLAGVSWAAIIGLLWHPDNVASHIFILALVLIIVAIRMMLASHSLPIVYAGTLPLITVLSVLFILQRDMLHFSLAFMTICTEFFFVVLARKMHGTALSMLAFRAQKDALIAELEEAKARSDEARAQAEDANLAKSRFLATMSHELRTPLNAVMGFSDVMRKELLGPHQVPAYKDYANDIHRSGEHLLNLINEILDLSRIEAGRYELKKESVSITDLGEDCLRLIQLRAKERGIELKTDFEPGMPNIHADARAIRQIWINLLSNAVKFTPAGGRVTLSVWRQIDGGACLSVTDTGAGMREEEIPQILSPFGQGSIARHRAEDGAGLGLPIVQGLARLHGAKLEIRSRLRHGTSVTIIFPPEGVLTAGNRVRLLNIALDPAARRRA